MSNSKYPHRYLLHLQYLGFRFHGWAKQKDVKTVHEMVDKTLRFVLLQQPFRTLAASRTDAKVSANHAAVAVFLEAPIDPEPFLADLNRNFPTDIRALRIEPVDMQFNVIQDPKVKEYLYLFSIGEKCHPFSASMMANFLGELDLELMKEGAKVFEGEHDFRRFCVQPKENQDCVREILLSEIVVNEVYQANFFPEQSYVFRVKGKGFLRNQVRMMMGALWMLGLGEMTMEELNEALEVGGVGEGEGFLVERIAPASGLILQGIEF